MGSSEPGYSDLHDYKIKKLFIARPGWKIIQADQSQLELRVAGALSMEPGFIEAYKNKMDMHSLNAKKCFDLGIDIVPFISDAKNLDLKVGSPEFDIFVQRAELLYIKKNHDVERTASKSVSFGILYGMSSFGLADDLNNKTREMGRKWTKEECDDMINKFHIGFPTLSKWLKYMQNFARKNGYTYNYFGRRREVPGVFAPDWKSKSDALRIAINTPVQGTGSDFMVLGIVNMRDALDFTKCELWGTVHDSVISMVREDYIEEYVAITRKCLETPNILGTTVDLCNRIPFVADFEIGDSYGSLSGYESWVKKRS